MPQPLHIAFCFFLDAVQKFGENGVDPTCEHDWCQLDIVMTSVPIGCCRSLTYSLAIPEHPFRRINRKRYQVQRNLLPILGSNFDFLSPGHKL